MPKPFFIFASLFIFVSLQASFAQRGYYDAPYKRFEADSASLRPDQNLQPGSGFQDKPVNLIG
jgi:hypothetical protein